MNIPNIISLFRIILIPIFTYKFVFRDNFVLAGIILIISGITDCLDGFIARKFNMITNIGKILDPIADKLTQVMVVLCLALKHYPIMWLLFALLVTKDLVLLIGGIVLYRKKDLVVSANWYGKISTIVFYVATIFIILVQPTSFWRDIIAGIIILSGIIALFGYISYFFSIRTKKI